MVAMIPAQNCSGERFRDAYNPIPNAGISIGFLAEVFRCRKAFFAWSSDLPNTFLATTFQNCRVAYAASTFCTADA
jgi:hypothetical protein